MYNVVYGCLHIHTCIHAYMYTCIHHHPSIHPYRHTNVRTYVRTYVHVHTSVQPYICTYGHTDIRTYVDTDIRTYAHSHIRTYVRTFMHACRQTDRDTDTDTHTHIHTHIYICICICIYIKRAKPLNHIGRSGTWHRNVSPKHLSCMCDVCSQGRQGVNKSFWPRSGDGLQSQAHHTDFPFRRLNLSIYLGTSNSLDVHEKNS